jgi:hypothetical protein
MAIPLDTKLAVPADVLVRDLQGESVLLNLKSENYFGLDEVGTRMWTVLTASPSIRAAYEALLEEYDVTPEKLREDLDDLVQKLVDKGLLEVQGG